MSDIKFFGKYRGTIIANDDPELVGRVMLMVPEVYGLEPSAWAEPCVPLSGPEGPPMGLFLVPPVGTPVWVEFEKGDPEFPIWSGCRWASSGCIPSLSYSGLAGSPNIVLQTSGQNSLVISDLPGQTGGITIKSASGATLIINETGIYIRNGEGASINMVGSTVTVNDGEFTVP